MIIRGQITRAGTMIVDGESLTGVFVETERRELEQPIPLYKNVIILEEKNLCPEPLDSGIVNADVKEKSDPASNS